MMQDRFCHPGLTLKSWKSGRIYFHEGSTHRGLGDVQIDCDSDKSFL